MWPPRNPEPPDNVSPQYPLSRPVELNSRPGGKYGLPSPIREIVAGLILLASFVGLVLFVQDYENRSKRYPGGQLILPDVPLPPVRALSDVEIEAIRDSKYPTWMAELSEYLNYPGRRTATTTVHLREKAISFIWAIPPDELSLISRNPTLRQDYEAALQLGGTGGQEVISAIWRVRKAARFNLESVSGGRR